MFRADIPQVYHVTEVVHVNLRMAL
ncbi:uncharacterized protein METZ01_LOCUS403415 [marine metagenome]|uniref:Uncharacterized protein n=1 Tax=marine metagenome TaxID=408172 RepID=A0A382VXE4_9ZZZZ